MFLKVFLVLLLLGGDRGLVPASLEAFPQVLGCDGRANILFAPRFPALQYFGNSGLFAGVLLVWSAKIAAFGMRTYGNLVKYIWPR